MATPYERGTRETLQRFGQQMRGRWNNRRGKGGSAAGPSVSSGGGDAAMELNASLNPSKPENFDWLMAKHAKDSGQLLKYKPFDHTGGMGGSATTAAAAAAKENIKTGTLTMDKVISGIKEMDKNLSKGSKGPKGKKVSSNWVEDAANPIREALSGAREGGLTGLFGKTEKAAFSRGATLGVMALPAGFAALNAMNSIRDKNYTAAVGWAAAGAAGAYGMKKLALSKMATKALADITKMR